MVRDLDDYPPVWVRGRHAATCDGQIINRHETVTVDALGRRGNGGIVAHVYTCNRAWAGCPARVLVPERTFRNIAAEAIGERG